MKSLHCIQIDVPRGLARGKVSAFSDGPKKVVAMHNYGTGCRRVANTSSRHFPLDITIQLHLITAKYLMHF